VGALGGERHARDRGGDGVRRHRGGRCDRGHDATTVQLLTLAPSAPATAGASSYGLRGLNSPGLRLEHVTVLAAAGTAGAAGMGGADGAARPQRRQALPALRNVRGREPCRPLRR
jgi:hypothetical protein